MTDALNRNAQTIIVSMVLALMGWVGFTLMSAKEEMVRIGEKLSQVIEKSREIVPRSENDRRYTALERAVEQNSDRISKVEAQLMRGGR